MKTRKVNYFCGLRKCTETTEHDIIIIMIIIIITEIFRVA